jgi:hypothetical protein
MITITRLASAQPDDGAGVPGAAVGRLSACGGAI